MTHASSATELDEMKALLIERWKQDISLRDWWAFLASARFTFPEWPEPWGRSWDADRLARRREFFAEIGAIGPPPGLGTLMGGPVVIEHGTGEQQQRWLPDLANGTAAWCQLFSEPGAGSDLAGLTTTAERDGDDWVVTGQKVWTSGSAHADAGMLVARTNWDVPKHRGLTYFIIPMDQPGVEVRPLKQMNGASHFSEVFLDEARVVDSDRIGDVGGGWAIATATLGHERRGLGAATVPGPRPEPGERAGQLDRAVGDIVAEHVARTGGAGDDSVTEVADWRRICSIARERSRFGPTLADRVADLAVRSGIEAQTARRSPLLAKLAWTERLRRASAAASTALGADGMLDAGDDPVIRDAAGFVLSVPSASIAGGTDEIQRNIIAERALGLPREPSTDRDVAFRDVPRNA